MSVTAMIMGAAAGYVAAPSGPTAVTRFIDRDVIGGAANGTSWANAYPSITAWQNAEAKNLVAADEVHTVFYRASPGNPHTAPFSFSGWTTDATRHFSLIVPPENRHSCKRGTGTRHSLGSYGFGFPLGALPAYCTVEGLLLEGTSGERALVDVTNINTNWLGVAAFLGGGAGGAVRNTVNGTLLQSCAFLKDGAEGAITRTGGTNWNVINCTIITSSTTKPAIDPNGALVKGCYISNGGGVNAIGTFGTIAADVYSSDGSRGSPALALASAGLVDVTPGAQDLRLTAGSPLIGASATNSADPAWKGAAVDFVGTPRPQGAAWDVGAHEFA